MDQNQREALTQSFAAMADFKRAFGKDLSPAALTEVLVAEHLGLTIDPRTNNPGFDARSQTGDRYQIKYRAVGTKKVYVNNFEFDFVVLVNLDENYQISGTWQMDQKTALQEFKPQANKFRITQDRFKSIAQPLK